MITIIAVYMKKTCIYVYHAYSVYDMSYMTMITQ
jgi:hypothetical protein